MKRFPSRSVAVVGGLNLDIYAIPDIPPQPRDSTPGRVLLSVGGVGHNIARHLAAMGVETELYTLLGDDSTAAFLKARCAREGVGLSHALQVHGRSCAYVCQHDENGDMLWGLNDMALLDRLTPAHVEDWLPRINRAGLCVADANLPQPALEALVENARVPILLDPVSCFKADRTRSVLAGLEAVKPNEREAAHLSGQSDPARAAEWFLRQGVRRVFISLGAQGVYFADANESGSLSASRLRTPNSTGAGDAMVAGIARGMLEGLSTQDCASLGQQAVISHLIGQGGTLL